MSQRITATVEDVVKRLAGYADVNVVDKTIKSIRFYGGMQIEAPYNSLTVTVPAPPPTERKYRLTGVVSLGGQTVNIAQDFDDSYTAERVGQECLEGSKVEAVDVPMVHAPDACYGAAIPTPNIPF